MVLLGSYNLRRFWQERAGADRLFTKNKETATRNTNRRGVSVRPTRSKREGSVRGAVHSWLYFPSRLFIRGRRHHLSHRYTLRLRTDACLFRDTHSLVNLRAKHLAITSSSTNKATNINQVYCNAIECRIHIL